MDDVRPIDDSLIRGLECGDPAAVESLVRGHARRIRRVVARILGDSSDVEEVTQDVLLAAIRNIARFRRTAAFSTWLYRIAWNAACQRRRGQQRRREEPLEPGLHAIAGGRAGREPDPLQMAIASEARRTVGRALGCLPRPYRDVVVLRDLVGLSSGEAARALGLSVAALKARHHRARRALRLPLAALRDAGGARSA